MKRNKVGISLIVLVLTIIIMIILATAVIVTLSNSNVIDRADEAVTKTDVAQLQQLASIAWAEAYAKSVEDGKTLSQKDLETAVNNYLKDNGYSEETLNNYDIKVDLEGAIVSKKGTPKEEQEKFEQEFLAWQQDYLEKNNNQMPETFIYGDYEYGYNQYGLLKNDEIVFEKTYGNTWGVRLIADKNKKEYGPILASAFGKPIGKVSHLYYGCEYLEQVPIIPESVTSMNGMFKNCISLTSLPRDFIIPNQVKDVSNMFSGCKGLQSLPEDFLIPDSVTTIFYMFRQCSSLKSLPEGFTFANLKFTDTIGVEQVFLGCSSLTSLPEGFAIPQDVKSISSMFSGCKSLIKLPASFVIPESVQKMNYCFQNCSALTGTIEINSMATSYTSCFANTTKPITLTTTSTNVTKTHLETLAKTSYKSNVTVDSNIQ